MGRRLADGVEIFVVDPEGANVLLRGGVIVPGWAADQITRDDVWADSPSAPLADEPAASGSSTVPDGGETGSGPGQPPPRHGKGSGLDAWRAYAAAHEFDVADDAGRDDIIAALDDAGIPT